MLAQRAFRATRHIANARRFSSTPRAMVDVLRIGYVPEHFSTPLHMAKKHFGLKSEVQPFKTGTGAMIAALEEEKIDVAIGLTEGFVADLGKRTSNRETLPYKLVGTYVASPLLWSISVGAESEIKDPAKLCGARVGVSRIGSGSYVMPHVLADEQGWLKWSKEPFEVVPLGDFQALREGVNNNKADFFMWEHFTTKKYWDNGEIKRIGEIYTPWPSWLIAARDPTDSRLEIMADKLNRGILYFNEHRDEAVQYITENLDYSAEDAKAWTHTVKFSKNVRGVDPGLITSTISTLRKASVLDQKSGGPERMIGIQSSSQAD